MLHHDRFVAWHPILRDVLPFVSFGAEFKSRQDQQGFVLQGIPHQALRCAIMMIVGRRSRIQDQFAQSLIGSPGQHEIHINVDNVFRVGIIQRTISQIIVWIKFILMGNQDFFEKEVKCGSPENFFVFGKEPKRFANFRERFGIQGHGDGPLPQSNVNQEAIQTINGALCDQRYIILIVMLRSRYDVGDLASNIGTEGKEFPFAQDFLFQYRNGFLFGFSNVATLTGVGFDRLRKVFYCFHMVEFTKFRWNLFDVGFVFALEMSKSRGSGVTLCDCCAPSV
mmetsp:Transcript_8033/g.16754  ORF Transcript_8033/g.16754 Transcript_8033/m.16754 type:complete len:281 (-) Transcript_8033:134-976(-)